VRESAEKGAAGRAVAGKSITVYLSQSGLEGVRSGTNRHLQSQKFFNPTSYNEPREPDDKLEQALSGIYTLRVFGKKEPKLLVQAVNHSVHLLHDAHSQSRDTTTG
jgi:hypothetical protein